MCRSRRRAAAGRRRGRPAARPRRPARERRRRGRVPSHPRRWRDAGRRRSRRLEAVRPHASSPRRSRSGRRSPPAPRRSGRWPRRPARPVRSAPPASRPYALPARPEASSGRAERPRGPLTCGCSEADKIAHRPAPLQPRLDAGRRLHEMGAPFALGPHPGLQAVGHAAFGPADEARRHLDPHVERCTSLAPAARARLTRARSSRRESGGRPPRAR